jgi:tryptophan-rich sensory protein
VFLLQLALNAAWPWIFFGERRIDLALACIAALVAAIVLTMRAFWRTSPGAAVLLLPYLVWVLYATSLNAAIAYLN